MIQPNGHVSAKRGARGFTLIELVVTITLLGILVALSLPSFTAWIKNSQVRTVTEGLQNGLRLAQAESIRRNRQVVMSFTNQTPDPTASPAATTAAGGKNWWLQTVPQFGETAGEYITGGTLADVASGVTITATPASLKAVCFNSNGRVVVNATVDCASTAPTFDVNQTNADRPLRVLVKLGGQLHMCDPKRPTLSATTPDGCP